MSLDLNMNANPVPTNDSPVPINDNPVPINDEHDGNDADTRRTLAAHAQRAGLTRLKKARQGLDGRRFGEQQPALLQLRWDRAARVRRQRPRRARQLPRPARGVDAFRLRLGLLRVQDDERHARSQQHFDMVNAHFDQKAIVLELAKARAEEELRAVGPADSMHGRAEVAWLQSSVTRFNLQFEEDCDELTVE